MPTDREYLLGARLSGLLVNVGTLCLRQIFVNGVKSKLESHATTDLESNVAIFLNLVSTKKTLKECFKKKGLIRKEQWKLLYPDSGEASSQTFDITLLTFLVRNLELVEEPNGGWSCDTLDDDDISLGANINRLRTVRNQLYGHITTTAITNKQHRILSKELKKILLELHADPQSCTEWDNKFGGKNENHLPEMRAINEQLINLVRTDLPDIRTLQQNLICTIETLLRDALNQQNQRLITALDELKKSDLAESMPSKVLDIVSSLKEMLASVSLQFKDLFKCTEGVHKILFEIRKHQSENTKVQQEIKQEMREGFENQKKDLNEWMHNSNAREKNETLLPGLFFDDIDCKMITDRFKVLIITSAVQCAEKDLLYRKLGNAVGLCPWQVVIDLDYQISSGFFDSCIETLGKHIVPQFETYELIKAIKEQDKEAVTKSQKTLWIHANGSETLNCEPCITRFGKSISKIEPLLADILDRFPVMRTIICIAVILTDNREQLIAVDNIGQMIERLYDCHEKKIDIASSKFGIFQAEKNTNVMREILNHSQSYQIEWERITNTMDSFCQSFYDNYSNAFASNYCIPGSGRSVSLSDTDYVQMKQIMEVYHRDIGKVNSDIMSEQEYDTKVDEIKFRFLKGNAITHEALYLHENGIQMYVDRENMQNIKLEVQEELKRRNMHSVTNPSRKGFYLIQHDNSGGGTTCGRSLLFGLRKEYPCIEIMQFGPQLLDCLTKIYNKAQLPILLLIDNLDCQMSDILKLESCLENRRVKTLLVHLTRTVKATSPLSNVDSVKMDMKFVLNSHVTSVADIHAFKKLYDINEKKAFKLKVFMFGLFKFLGEFEKLGPLIDNCISLANIPQLKLMRAILIESKYVHTGVGLDFAMNVLNDYDEESMSVYQDMKQERISFLEHIETALGPIADFLVFDNMRLKIADDCIIKLFLSKLVPSDTGKQLELFLEDILKFAINDSDNKANSFNLICSFLIRGLKTEGGSFWTIFIEVLEETHDKCFITNITETFLDVFHGKATLCPHLRAFLARYLMHKVNNHENAIKQIRLSLDVSDAVGICETSVTDVVLLSVYGNLHRDMMIHKIKESIVRYKEEPKNMQLTEIYDFAFESVNAYKKAQECTKTSWYDAKGKQFALSFYSEANTRYALLSHIFTYQCLGNHQDFIRYITSTCPIQLVKESLPRALETLQNLEYLMALGRIEIDAETSQKVIRTKFDLLKLFTDDEKLPMVNRLSTMPDTIPCDFGYFMLNRRDKRNSLRQWKDLSSDELKFVIDIIFKRIPKPEYMLRNNYRDIITAMIYLRQLKSKEDNKYNLLFACQCAAEWVKKCPKDFEAHFILGFLMLLGALSREDENAIKEAMNCLETCKKICKDSPSVPAYCYFRYIIGSRDGLSKAVPYDKAIAKHLLMKFTGRKIKSLHSSHDCVSVECGKLKNAFNAVVLKNDNNSAADDSSPMVIPEQRRVTFNLAIALDRITATNLSLCGPNE